jgi:SAM-dependent methyltransferase
MSCRFAFHHFEYPAKAFAEMRRVCRPLGRIVLCDGVASSHPTKAAAFNAMERHRDPSTAEFRPLVFLIDLFVRLGFHRQGFRGFWSPTRSSISSAAPFRQPGDYDTLRHIIDRLIAIDAMDLGAVANRTKISYPSVILTGIKT